MKYVSIIIFLLSGIVFIRWKATKDTADTRYKESQEDNHDKAKKD